MAAENPKYVYRFGGGAAEREQCDFVATGIALGEEQFDRAFRLRETVQRFSAAMGRPLESGLHGGDARSGGRSQGWGQGA